MFFFTVEETGTTGWERCPETAAKSVSWETHPTYCFGKGCDIHGDLCNSDSGQQVCSYLCSLSVPSRSVHFFRLKQNCLFGSWAGFRPCNSAVLRHLH